MDSEQEDKMLAAKLDSQNSILETFERTIAKMSQQCKSRAAESKPLSDFSFAENFDKDMKKKHDNIDGLREDYIVNRDVVSNVDSFSAMRT